MDQFTKEGRKLRPRKNTGNNSAAPRSEKVEYHPGEHRSFSSRPYGQHPSRQSYGEHSENGGSYGERRPRQSYGEGSGNNYGEHRPRQSYGERQQSGENRFYGERRPRQSYGEESGNSYGERRPRQSYGEGSGNSYGERRPRQSYGERQQSGENRFYGDRQQSGEGRGYGDRKPRQYGAGGRNGGPRKPAGGRKPYGKRPSNGFTKASSEGINRMISRRPVVNGTEEVVDNVPVMIKDEIRLNKFIANSGVCSRREADTLIQAGVVTVNGEVVTELGTKVNIFEDDIRFNGERLKGEEKVYIVMNKPKGYVTTASDPHAEKTVIDLVKGCSTRVYPVGRLDKNTTGVLMLTNDGEIAERLTHPSYDKKKIYQVALDRPLAQEDFDKALEGVMLTDGEVCADELEYIDENDKRKLGIEIHSGKNRVVRRIFETLGYNVKALDRVYFAGLTKKGLKKGEWRYLTEAEANILRMGAYV